MEKDTLQNLFMKIIRSELLGQQLEEDVKRELSSDVISSLYSIARKHELAQIVSSALSNAGLLGNDDVSGKYKKQLLISLYRSEQMKRELLMLGEALSEAKIPYIPLKGAVLRDYYPESNMRTSSDIDILIHRADLDRAASLIEEKPEYKRGDRTGHDISFMSSNRVHLELHFALIEGNERVDAVLSEVWEHAAPISQNSYQYKLDDGFFLFYYIAHTAKHFIEGGCGVRPLLDLYVMEHFMKLDPHCADALIKRSNLEVFAENIFLLSNIWFGSAEHTKLTHDMQEYIFEGGAYGTLENYIAVSQVKKGGKFGHLLEKIFLPYHRMVIYYPSLEKHPWLYPIYQVRRWGRILFCGGAGKAFTQVKANQTISQDKSEEVRGIFSRLNL